MLLLKSIAAKSTIFLEFIPSLRFDEKIATAENTMNNYIILKKCRRQLIESQNTRNR